MPDITHYKLVVRNTSDCVPIIFQLNFFTIDLQKSCSGSDIVVLDKARKSDAPWSAPGPHPPVATSPQTQEHSFSIKKRFAL